MPSTINLAVKAKKIQMELEKLLLDAPADSTRGISIDNVNRYRSYKGQSKNQSEFEDKGSRFHIRICRAGRKGIYNT